MKHVLVAAAGALAFAAPLAGQTVRGLVSARASGDPIVADIALVDTAGMVMSATRSADDGSFMLGTRRTGVFMLRAVAIGYAEVVTDTFSIAQGEEVMVRIRLSVQPVALPALEVTERRRPPFLGGFHQRRETGFGRYITREQIEARDALTVPDILRTTPGVRIVPLSAITGRPDPRGWYVVQGRRRCTARLVIDGVEAPNATEMINTIPPHQIEGIEVYAGVATLPPELAGSFDNGCGVVAIWTRRGTPDGRGSTLWKRIAAGAAVVVGTLLVFTF